VVAIACGSAAEPTAAPADAAATDGGVPLPETSTPETDASWAIETGTGDVSNDATTSAGSGASAEDAGDDGSASTDATVPLPAVADAGAAEEAAPLGGSVPDAGGCVLESISVTAGAAATFTTSLQKDATYLLKAAGSLTLGNAVGNAVGNQRVDAEFAFAPGGAGSDVVGGVDVGIDVGLLWPNRPTRYIQTPPGPSRMKWNPLPQVDAMNNVTPGALFRADTPYYMIVIGNGQPLSLNMVLPPMASASGSITVSLYALSPAPPAMYILAHSTMPKPPAPPKICGAVLDSIDVSVLTPAVVTSKYPTNAGKMYLLQASGTAPTGSADLGDGDAEYMSFGSVNDATAAYPLFNGYNDGEACADFGLGVDELTVSHCHMNTMCIHRKNWWGTVGIARNSTTTYSSPTYRNDHVYYMIYAGTGKPISFVYFDSGYGDNQPFDILARIFPLP
jgi:hypothetical protein